jgi:hypothetical protein
MRLISLGHTMPYMAAVIHTIRVMLVTLGSKSPPT